MGKFLYAALMAAALLAPIATSAEAGQYRSWGEYRRVVKQLPEGFHDFKPIPPRLREWHQSESVVCTTWKQAISLGKRLALGYSDTEAAISVNDAWGKNVCGYLRPSRQVYPLEYAARGDDAGRRIYIIKWKDRRGGITYTGIPE